MLIIEDEAMIALDLEYLLASEGATSFAFAASEIEAVALAQDQRPDVITSDVTLLEGTGPAAVATIRAMMGSIPVIYISGTSPDRCAAEISTWAITKPLDRSVVVEIFRDIYRSLAF